MTDAAQVTRKLSDKMGLRLWAYFQLIVVATSLDGTLNNDKVLVFIALAVALLGLIGLTLPTLKKDIELPQFHLILGGIAVGGVLMNTFNYFLPPG